MQDGKQHTPERPVPTLVGATNPFFLRSRVTGLSILALAPDVAPAAATTSAPAATRSAVQRSPSLLPSVSSTAGALSSFLSGGQGSGVPSDVVEGRAGGLWLAERGVCAGPDKATLAKLSSSAPRRMSSRSLTRSVGAATAALRAHFWALSTAFLAPFCLFCGVLPPWDAATLVRAPVLCVAGLLLQHGAISAAPPCSQVSAGVTSSALSSQTPSHRDGCGDCRHSAPS